MQIVAAADMELVTTNLPRNAIGRMAMSGKLVSAYHRHVPPFNKRRWVSGTAAII